MKTVVKILIVLSFILIAGCRDVREVKTYQDLAMADGLEIVTIDSTVYTAAGFYLKDSSIVINGEKRKNYTSEAYKGSIQFKDILYIQTGDEKLLSDPVKAIVPVVLLASSDFLGDKGLSSFIKFSYGNGTGSCPMLYSFNGSRYILEGETFGTSLGRALESETPVVLRSIQPVGGEIKLKFTNERPETHFFNSIKLFSVETDNDENVVIDNNGSFVAVKNNNKVYKAEDRGEDISRLITSADDTYWRSDLSTANMYDGYEDAVYLEMNNKENSDSIALCITARNTEISAVLFKMLMKRLGKNFTSFTRAAETDKELIAILKNALERSALKVDVFDGTTWRYCGEIYPEANMVDFTRLVVLPSSKDQSNFTRIRLRGLTDTWQLNEVNYSTQFSRVINQKELEPVQSDKDLKTICAPDNSYIKLLPGEEINLVYKESNNAGEKKITYVASASGYLYEYIIDTGTAMDKVNPDFPGLNMLKILMDNPSLLYPGIYKEWSQLKQNNPGL